MIKKYVKNYQWAKLSKEEIENKINKIQYLNEELKNIKINEEIKFNKNILKLNFFNLKKILY